MKKILLFFFCCLSTITFAQTPTPLGKPINTQKFTEYAPTLSADGSLMVFQSNNNPYKAWYLYETHRQANGKWAKPRIIESIRAYAKQPNEANGFQTNFIAAPCLSADGQTLYFSANFHSGLGGRDIYFVRKNTQGQWSSPINAGEVINSPAHEDFPSISPDGKQLYFARPLDKRQQGQVCYELLVTQQNPQGKWNKPRSLPSPINTGCEKCPRIQADGLTLFFSSLRKGGKGDFDLYKAVLGIRGEKWTALAPIKEINTPAFEQFATVLGDNSTLYYNSQGTQSPDVFQISPVPAYLHLQQVVKVKGVIVAQVTQGNNYQPLAAKVDAYLSPKRARNLLQTTHNQPQQKGSFELMLRKGYQYELVAEAEGYTPQKIAVDLRNWAQKTYPINSPLVLVPVNTTPVLIAQKESTQKRPTQNTQSKITQLFIDTQSGKVVYAPQGQVSSIKLSPLPNLRFAYKSFALNQAAQTQLQGIANLLQTQPLLRLQISAHTDATGSLQKNQRLSAQRAAVVKQYLIARGIAANRLQAQSFGASQPTPNGDDAANRRVELNIIK